MTWDGPNWKTKTKKSKRARATRARKLARTERSEKQEVRVRDQHCRFPRCGCQRVGGMKAIPTVSHKKHKGMGGNPTGDRSVAALMILACKWRHQDGRASVDNGTLRYVPLTERGCNGPVRWEIDQSIFWPAGERVSGQRFWRPIWIETAVNIGAAPDDWAVETLDELARMEL